ncbi:MAG TPA: carboxyl transferase domain-containing protein [Ramlibacter sp.]|nr:carboxyl transferase domain-containing protein [Ramlibacter sp.]
MPRFPSAQWGPELEDIEARRSRARQMGGAESLARIRARGMLDARERVQRLLDPDSFQEFGILAGKARYGERGELNDFAPATQVLGTGRIDARKVVVVSDDFSLRGGSSEAAVAEKWIYSDRYAHEYRLPLVRIVHSAGGSVNLPMQMGYTKIPGYALLPSVPLLGLAPVVGVVMGPAAGLGAIRAGTSHFCVMVKGQGQVFAGGPPVVRQALGIDVDKENLGGWEVHKASGVVHNGADSEDDALAQARRFLSYLPANVYEQPPRHATGDPPHRAEPWLNDAIPRDRRKVFDPRPILRAIFDGDSVFEMAPHFGGSLLTCLARLDGWPVGVMINNPKVMGGALTRAAAQKLERFVDLCDTFHLPIVNLVDQPGSMTGPDAEREGTIAAVLRASSAIEQSSVPWLALVIRRCFGLAGGMLSPWNGAHDIALPHRFAWPSARWGSIPIEGGVDAAYARDIEAAADPQQRRAELEALVHAVGSPLRTAERFGVVDVIEPALTRELLCEWVADAYRACASRLGPKRRTMR